MTKRNVGIALAVLLFFALACGSSTTNTTSNSTDLNTPTTKAAVAATTKPGDPSPTTGPTDTPAPTKAPDATATVAGQAKVEMGDYTHYIDSIKSVWFVGVVKNNGTAASDSIQVVLSLLDDAGSTVGTGKTTVGVILKPGDHVGFRILMDKAPEKWTKETFQVQADNYDPNALFHFGNDAKGLSITGDKMAPGDYKAATITGQIKNGGAKTAEYVKVIAVGYDAKGKVIDVNDGYSKLDKIPAGQSGPFSIDLGQQGETIAKYDLFVTGGEATK